MFHIIAQMENGGLEGARDCSRDRASTVNQGLTFPGQDTAVSLIVWGNLGMSWSLGPGLGVREAGRRGRNGERDGSRRDGQRKGGD